MNIRIATTTADKIPPIEPSTVLFGETSGINFRFPIDLPTKYAPISVDQTMNKAKKTTANPLSRAKSKL